MELTDIIQLCGGILGVTVIAVLSWFRKAMWAGIVSGIKWFVQAHRSAFIRLCLTTDERTRVENSGHSNSLENKRMRQYMEVDQLLTLLLNSLEADRAFIFKFHNGSFFSLEEPIWKMSNSHEICQSHIRYYSNELQDIKISLVTNVIGPMLLGTLEKEEHGAHRIARCKSCPLNYDCTYRMTYQLNIDNMRPSNFKQLWQMRGIRHTLMCNLLVRGKNVGFIGVDFCNALSKALVQKNLCEAAEKVQFSLLQSQSSKNSM